MVTLEACVDSFGAKVTGPFLADIWGALRAEVQYFFIININY